MAVTAALLSEERRARLDAAGGVALDQDGMYALRGALVGDDDAEVRGIAAERLGLHDVVHASGAVVVAVRIALQDALEDESAWVRERAVQSLSRHYERDDAGEGEARKGDERAAVCARFEELTRFEPNWRVRRVAVRAQGTVAGRDALGALADVLDDPFWRVRYAAIQALAPRPDCAPELEARPTTPRRRAALAYLRSVWSGERAILDAPGEPELALPDDDALDDEDPAVVAARLAHMEDHAVTKEALVPLLASPHVVLRRLAIKRLAAREDDEEISAAVAMLDEPRRPYAREAIMRLLSRVDTRRVRASVLQARPSPARIAWALLASAKAGDDVDALAGELLTHEDARVRRAAAHVAGSEVPMATLRGGLGDQDERVRAACIDAVARRGGADALEILASLDPWRVSPVVARALVAGLTRLLAQEATRSALLRMTMVSDPSARAAAIAVLSEDGALSPDARARAASDPDPWIRHAALAPENATSALEDPDPTVRRAAFDVLVRSRSVSPRALEGAMRSDDAWVRARAADALSRSDEIAALESLLRLTRDAAPMVRAAAAESLAGHPHVVDVCLAVVTREPPVDESLRLAAHGRLVAEGTAAAFSALEHDVATRELSPGARWALLGMSLAYPEDVRAGTELVFEPRARIAYVEPRRKPAVVEQRPLGKGGVLVAPLAISGAFNVPVSSLERAREAGVNTFFWEPEHRTLGEHISRAEDRRELVVIAGSYEADAQTITRDAERALRRLKIDALGAMLLFWVRSPARLSDEAFGALERLKSSGKVRAIGFSTHLRELAAEAIAARPWDVVMCRHSAAHTALETTVLPVAREKNVGVITFSALVYGRMLSPASSGVGLVRDGETERFSAADCYRYTLAQPGVSVCLSAPRRQRELEENLDVLRSPALDPDVARRLREHGARVRAENRAFMSLVREA